MVQALGTEANDGSLTFLQIWLTFLNQVGVEAHSPGRIRDIGRAPTDSNLRSPAITRAKNKHVTIQDGDSRPSNRRVIGRERTRPEKWIPSVVFSLPFPIFVLKGQNKFG